MSAVERGRLCWWLLPLLLLNGCLGSHPDRNSTAAKYRIYPPSPSVTPGASIAFRVTGPRLSGVQWFLRHNESGARLDGQGRYLAGTRENSTDRVTARLPRGQTLDAYVQVGGMLTVTPEYASVRPGKSLMFAAQGGSGSYQWRIVANQAGGRIDPQSGVYVAAPPPLANQKDVIEVRDAAGHTATAVVFNGSAHMKQR